MYSQEKLRLSDPFARQYKDERRVNGFVFVFHYIRSVPPFYHQIFPHRDKNVECYRRFHGKGGAKEASLSGVVVWFSETGRAPPQLPYDPHSRIRTAFALCCPGAQPGLPQPYKDSVWTVWESFDCLCEARCVRPPKLVAARRTGADPETASHSMKDKRIVRIPILEQRIAAAALSR
jgi:hypothetical protein